MIPARDPAPGLMDAIESALDQGADLDDVIVVDDGLTSDTVADLDHRFGDRVAVTPGPLRGAGAARNAGVLRARTDWIAFLDADDYWLHGHAGAMRRAVSATPAAGVCFGAALHIGDAGEVLVRFIPHSRHANLAGLLRRRLQPTTSATAVRREAFLAVGGFHEGFEHPAGVEDIDLWWRIAARFQCRVQQHPFACYVVHPQRIRSRSRAELLQLARDRRRCIERLRGRTTRLLFRTAAAKHHAIMARYWYLAGFSRDGIRHAAISLIWIPTLDGVAALTLGLLPRELRDRVRAVRYRVDALRSRTRGL